MKKLSDKKVRKYRKIISKKIDWFDKKIIKKCLYKKRYKKLQTPQYLNSFIKMEKIKSLISIRKLQMYLKQFVYWIQDNSAVLSQYMRNQFVENSIDLLKCMQRIKKYRKILLSLTMDASATDNLSVNQGDRQMSSLEEVDESIRYENKMKEFKRMLERDRGISQQRYTKILLGF